MKGNSLSGPASNAKNEQTALSWTPSICYRKQTEKRLLKQIMSLRNLSFSLSKAGEGRLIKALYLELFLGGLIWGEKGVVCVGGGQRKDKRM